MSACSADRDDDLFTLDARNGSAEATLAAAETDREYLLFPFSAPSENPLSKKGAFEITVSRAATASSLARGPAQDTSDITNRIAAERSAHSWKWKETPQTLLRSRAIQAIEPNLTIFSPFSGEKDTPISGTLRAKTDSVAIYVDDRVNASATDGDIESIRAGVADITVPRLHAVAGTESDVDGNGVIFIFLASPDSLGKNSYGFFRYTDLLPDGVSSSARSNEAEIIYARVPESGIAIEQIHATIAHELFHLIHFVSKSFELSQASGGILGASESLFLSEGLAHLAEDLVGWGVDTPIFVKIYFDCFPYTSLAGGGEAPEGGPESCGTPAQGGDSVPRRGGDLLFLLYLFQQAGGALYSETMVDDIQGGGVKLLKALITSKETGIENIQQTTARSFFELYADFLSAIALDNTGFGVDVTTQFLPEESDPFTGLLRNIRTHSDRVDANGKSLTLEGPLIQSTADSIFYSGAAALRFTFDAGSTMAITASGDGDLDLGLAVVRTR